MLQRTLNDCGLPELVETRLHPEDIVTCVDGTELKLKDAFTDVEGNYYTNEDDVFDAHVQFVEDILNNVAKQVEEYTQSEDYAEAYLCILGEGCYKEKLVEYITDNTDCSAELAESISEFIDEDDITFDIEFKYQYSEWGSYDGPGLCLDSFGIGEYEEQVDIDSVPTLKALHELGVLDDILDKVNCDAYVSRDRSRVKDEDTGTYVYKGRDTYNPYNREHPDLTCYVLCGGSWHFIITPERIDEIFQAALTNVSERYFNA